jgi:hypothetical protein
MLCSKKEMRKTRKKELTNVGRSDILFERLIEGHRKPQVEREHRSERKKVLDKAAGAWYTT